MKNNRRKNIFNVFGKFFKSVGSFFLNLLFPEDLKCLFCGQDVPDFENKPFCLSCQKQLSFNNANRCMICSEPIGNEATVCDSCQKHKRNFKKAFCPFVYDGLVRSAILGFKDSNLRYKAKTFAKFIAEEINCANVKIDVVTYIPMTKKKERKRTFNQSQLLAKELAKLLDVEMLDMFEKVKDTKGQKFLSFKERQENMIGMYKLKTAKFKTNQNVLIVDDVITTCATINYCAGLINKKTKNVYACAIARNKPNFSTKWKTKSKFSNLK